MLFHTVQTGPFPCYFTNVNTTHHLPGHSHYAELTLTWQTLDPPGFPSFQDTHQDLQNRLLALTQTPFRNATNEAIASTLWDAFQAFPHDSPTVQTWQAVSGGSFRLQTLELAVMGAPDRIGHASGLTRYRIRLSAED